MIHQDPLSAIVGRNLKSLIKESKYKTQNNFADAAYVNPTTVRRWIANGIKDIDTIEQLADLLEVDFGTILNP